ncbi:hypothetical protein SAMN05444416_11916 [Thermoactinomyces sp. DSM 45892]|nr:hypothetical protein SAMN05444416_11916 [Thermoactinomyces sp. DSM 45892]
MVDSKKVGLRGMSWLKEPKGGDNQLKGIPRIVLLYMVIPVGVLLLLVQVWPYLEETLEGRKTGQIVANETKKVVVDTAGSLWDVALQVLFWGLLVAAIGAVLWAVGGYILYRYYRQQALLQARYIRILPSDDTILDIEKITVLTRTFGEMHRHRRHRILWGPPWFRLRFAMPLGSNEIGIYLSFPLDKKSSVIDTIRGTYPNAEIHDLKPSQFPQPTAGGVGGIFTDRWGKRKGLPLASLEQKKASMLGDVLNCLRPGSFIDLQFSPVKWSRFEKRFEGAYDDLKDKKMSDLDPEEKQRKISLIKRTTGRELPFKMRLSIWSNSPQAVSVIRSTAESITTTMNYDGAIRFWLQSRWNPMADANPIPTPLPGSFMIWSGEEMANLFHLPPATHFIYQDPELNDEDPRGKLLHISQNQRSLAENEWTDGVLIGKVKHPLYTREVRVPHEHLSRHFLLTGASGMGKSSAGAEIIQSMIDDWIQNPEAPGFTIIDPAREIIAIIENRLRYLEGTGVHIPKEKIHHFNLSTDTTHVVGLNLLHSIPDIPVNELSEQIADILLFKQIPGDLQARTRRLLAMAIHSLLEDNVTHTVLGIDDFFRNEKFRQSVLENGKDPYVKRYWAKFDQQMNLEIEPILAQIDPLLQDPTMRRIFLQKESLFAYKKAMDEGHLVLFDLYDMQDNEVKVTVGHLVHLYHQYSKQRDYSARFHLMLVEEAHLVQIPVVTALLSEDAKYNFGIGLVTRDIDSFHEENFMQAIKGNIGMILSCAQHEGADEVESLTRGSVKTTFLERLQERNVAVYLRTKKNQRSHTTVCVVENDPPFVYLPDGKIADHRTEELGFARRWGLDWGLEIMRQSAEARPIEEIDPQIAEYMTENYNIHD